MSSALKTELVAKGEAASLINTILGYAQTLNTANISQEGYKGARKILTKEALEAFNGVYNKVISIARISSKFFKGDATTQSLFSYSKVLKALNSHPRAGTPPTP